MIQVIGRALGILELLAGRPDEALALGEIAAAMELNLGTCGNILKSLAERGYVERLEGRRGYRLGPMARRLGGVDPERDDLIPAAQPVLQRLTQSWNETSLLGILRHDKRITLCSAASDRDLQARGGRVREAYETATGRVLLAFCSPEQLRLVLQKAGLPSARVWSGVRSREDLDRQLAEIRRQELAETRSAEHVAGLAVPVRRGEQVVAGVSIYLPEVRYTPTRRRELIRALRQAAEEISRGLS